MLLYRRPHGKSVRGVRRIAARQDPEGCRVRHGGGGSGRLASLDRLAEAAEAAHAFLRAAWFRAAGDAPLATLVARRADGEPVAAIPQFSRGKGPLRLSEVPGSYWPYRSFPIARDASDAELAALLASPAARGARPGLAARPDLCGRPDGHTARGRRPGERLDGAEAPARDILRSISSG